MDLQLKGKHTFVSGSSVGIGFAIARRFAMEEAVVYVNGRDQGKVTDAVTRIKNEIPTARVEGITADLTKPDGFQKVSSTISHIDVLINNLGIFEPVSFFESKDEDWIKLFETNVMTGIRLTRRYMPGMMERGWGRVLFVSSESALQIPTEMIHYGLSKTAQLSVTNGLAQLTKGIGVTVNSILPGPTFSEGVERFIGDLAVQRDTTLQEVEQQYFTETRPLSLLQRFISPDEVAATAAFISSPLAAATNGAAIRVDGGILKGLH